jgi:hypothetical protein
MRRRKLLERRGMREIYAEFEFEKARFKPVLKQGP